MHNIAGPDYRVGATRSIACATGTRIAQVGLRIGGIDCTHMFKKIIHFLSHCLQRKISREVHAQNANMAANAEAQANRNALCWLDFGLES